ncbi:type II secretion system protein [bacterium]|nr:type II secretion system protein [bacterium]
MPKRGFTISELVVAIGLLAIIAVVVIGLFLRITVSSTKSVDQSAALELAHRVLDEYADADPSTWNAVQADEDLQTHDPALKTTFYYRLRNRRINGSGDVMGDLYRLDVDVSWWPADPTLAVSTARRRDYGKLSLHLSRTVFVEQFK